MKKQTYSVMLGTGSCIPEKTVFQKDFLNSSFYGLDGNPLPKTTKVTVDEFVGTAGISERKYVEKENASDLAYQAARKALESSNIDPESIDCIIVAENFGDIQQLGTNIDLVPAISSRVKNSLHIVNPYTLAFDLIGRTDTLNDITAFLGYNQGNNLILGADILSQSTNPSAASAAAQNLLYGRDGEKLENIMTLHYSDGKMDSIPSIAERVKDMLGIVNPDTKAYDLVFGCPGQVEGMVHANQLIKSGKAKKVLVIGTETLSKVSDPHDRDSMIYADGAGAVILGAIQSETPIGILSHAARSDTHDHAYLLRMGQSYNPHYANSRMFIKMDGNNVYKYALRYVPRVVKESLEKANLSLDDVQKVIVHQANKKMDEQIMKGVGSAYKKRLSEEEIEAVLPLTVSWLGNSSVATVPILLDLLSNGHPRLNNHKFSPEDYLVLGSVGAGMNINSIVYRIPSYEKALLEKVGFFDTGRLNFSEITRRSV